MIRAETVAINVRSAPDLYAQQREPRTRIERIPSMPLNLIQEKIDFASVEVQPLNITHPVNPNPLLYHERRLERFTDGIEAPLDDMHAHL